MSPGAQNMNTGPDVLDTLGTAENDSGSEKHEIGPDALGTAENGSGRAKHENGTDALDTAENESGCTKH
jgi:hypothetical protein